MAQQRVARTSLANLRPLGGPGERSYEFVTRKLSEALGSGAANLFAEPVTRSDGGESDWMTERLGDVRRLTDLPADEAQAVEARLAALLGQIEELIETLERSSDVGALRQAQALKNAIEVPRRDCVYSVGGEPVLVLWAYRYDSPDAPTHLLRRRFANAAAGAPPPVAAPLAPPVVRFRPDSKGIVVGREEGDGRVMLRHPSIARRHALYRRENGRLIVRDLGSETGTFVNGVRIHREREIEPGDRVDIGPYRFGQDGEAVEARDEIFGPILSLRNLSQEVRVQGGAEPLRILADVSLDLPAGEFVCIVGPSGSGKSTLLNVIAGRVRPSAGKVLFNGLDVHRHFDLVKQSIAMVPQHNLLHETLTLRRALGYTAALRLPTTVRRAERRQAVIAAIDRVGLGQRVDTRIMRLSGGQKKRASLANELLDRPKLLFLDEVTSGLDESTDREIMSLLHGFAAQGTSIVCVTHTLANIEEFCDRLIVMRAGGVLAFEGPPDQALVHFGVDRLAGVFDRLAEHPTQRAAGGPAPAPAVEAEPQPRRLRPLGAVSRFFRQTAILSRRNLSLLVADKRIWGVALVQSLLIGILIGYVFSDLGPEATLVTTKISLLLLLSVAALWIGCNTASKDIVGEREIFEREYDVNLTAAAFFASKLLVTGTSTILQACIVFGLTMALAQEIPGDPTLQLALTAFAAFAGCCLGLLISSVSLTTEQATTIVPLVMVPQLVLCGVLVPYLPPLAEALAETAITSNALVESMKSIFFDTAGPIYGIGADTGQRVELDARDWQEGVGIIAIQCVVAISLALALTTRRQITRRRIR